MSNKDHSNYIYVLESDLCIKIGISNDPHTRLYNINHQCKSVSVPEFELRYFKDCRFVVTSSRLEKHLHNKYKDSQFTGLPAKIFGYTEMFEKGIMQDVISEIESTIVGDYSILDYDPFLCLKGFVKYKEQVFNEMFSKVITESYFGITKSSVNSYKRLDINTFCANLKYAKDNGYDLLHMTTFADRSTTTNFANRARKVILNGCFEVSSESFETILDLCGEDQYTRRVCSGIRKKLDKQETLGFLNKTKFLALPSLTLEEPYNRNTKVLLDFKMRYGSQVLGNSFNCVIT